MKKWICLLTAGTALISLAASQQGRALAQTGLDRVDARPDEGPARKKGGLRGKGGDRPPRPEPRPDNSPSAFLDNRDGTVTDKSTGLQWQRNDGGEMTWEKAGQYCAGLSLAGHQDWRLPTTREAFGSMDQSRPKPAMDTRAFPPSEAEYWWTSEARADDPNRVWVTNAGGGAGPHPKSETVSAGGSKRYHARCVRSSSPPPAAAGYIDNGDGTVTDHRTGLVWQKAEAPAEMTWEEALRYVKGLGTGGKTDWRLPNIKELQSLNDEKTVRPSIDRKFFPETKPEEYWSSTAMGNRPDYAWTVDFTVGIVSYSEMTEKAWVRAVRGGSKLEK